MTEFGKPQPCRNKCGAWIYFDRDSKLAHTSPDNWIPLEYSVDTGLRTGRVHKCPNWSEIQRDPIASIVAMMMMEKVNLLDVCFQEDYSLMLY
jgi:hypothetical protein